MIDAIKPLLLASVSAMLFVACAPRGENITVEQAYENAKSRFIAAESSAEESLTPDVKEKVIALGASLEKLGDAQQAQQVQTESKVIAATLTDLLPIAGYQNRPSLDEVRKEHIKTAVQSDYTGAVDAAAKLLAMRTYSILSSELEGTKFKVDPLA